MFCYLRMKPLAFNLVSQVVHSVTSQCELATVATSGKSGEGTVLQMHGRETYLYSFNSYSVAMNTGKNYEDFGTIAIGSNVENEN